VLRTHSETVLLLALAAASTRFRSSGLNRTGTILPLAADFGSRGRPGFLALGCFGIAQLLHDGGSYGCFRGNGWGDIQDGYAAFRMLWIVCVVAPSVGVGSFGVSMQFKDFDYSFPNRLASESLFNGYAFDVRGVDAVEPMDNPL
jgi:hypothetical protein